MSIQSAANPNIPDVLVIQKHRIGSIVLLDGLNLTSSDNILHVVRRGYVVTHYMFEIYFLTHLLRDVTYFKGQLHILVKEIVFQSSSRKIDKLSFVFIGDASVQYLHRQTAKTHMMMLEHTFFLK